MINLSKSGDTIVFEFVNNGHYLENGTIEVPVNSLSLVIDSSNMATFKKASSNDVFIAATYDELGMTKAELETFYKENMAGSTGGGGGATYSAGLGIEIDSADTITAIYEGYPQVDDEAKTIRLSNTTDPFYVMNTNAVSTSGATRFKLGSKNRIAIYDFAQHTVTIDGEEWPDYLTWQWSDSYNMFLITPLQSIPSATANTISSGTTFVMPSGVTLVNSGKTTSVINEVRKIADSSVKGINLSVSDDNHVNLSYTTGDGWPEQGFIVDGGLVTSSQNNKLSTKVIASAAQKWIDITIPQYHQTIYISPTKSIQFDLTDAPGGEGFDVIVGIYFETIIKGDGSLLNDPGVDVNVTLENGHVTVTVKDGVDMYINGFSSNGNSLYDFIDNAKEYGYEYTTVDNAIETLFNDKADTSAVTESINAAVSGKVDTTDFATYSGTVETALSGKQDTLSAGTGIEISDNVISATGGGGTTYSAGTNISISTANTISCTLPITVDSTKKVYNFGTNITQGLYSAFVYGYDNNFTNIDSSRFADYNIIGNANSGKGSTLNIFGKRNTITHTNNSRGSIACTIIGSGNTSSDNGQYNNSNRTIIGNGNIISASSYSTAIGNNLVCGSANETALGRYNKSVTEDISQTSHSGNTLFSVGNGTSSARHNAFEIRQNGDIYITKDGQDVKLQDQLGGGGGTVSSAITSGDTNAVAGGAVYDKFDEVEQVTAAALNNLSAAFDGLKLKKLTQAQYDALSPNYDNNTLYVII